jgi:hypothetical protein
MNQPEEERGGANLAEAPPEFARNPEHDNVALAPVVRPICSRMELSARERDLAIHIKQAIANTADLDPVSDFMCAQLALMDGDNIEQALHRVHHLQCFKEEYGILDTVQDGTRCFEAYIDLFPRIHLSLAYCQESGEYVIIYDNTQFETSRLNSEERLRTWLGGVFYTCHVVTPDFAAMRCGTTLVLENEGYIWNCDMQLFTCLRRLWSEVTSVYPVHVKRLKYFHSGAAMNVLVAMLKPFLPKDLRENVETGCFFDQRLDTIYLVPTLEDANLRFLNRVTQTLQRRYDNERAFRLS